MNYVITTNCNKGCPYCFAHENRKNDPNSFMDLEKFKKLLGKSESHVKLIGGEPTQHPDFKAIVQELVDQKKDFTLISNFLFGEEVLNIILYALDNVRVSFLVNATDLDIGGRITKWSNNYNTIYKKLYAVDREQELSIGLTLVNDLKYYLSYLDMIIDNVAAVENLRLSISFPGDKEDKNKFEFIKNKELGTMFLGMIHHAISKGIKPNIDCVLFPCLFKNKEEFKYINKFVDKIETKCGENGSPADIFPDETISYCYPLKESISLDTNKYDRMELANQDMMLRYKMMKSQVSLPEACLECRFLGNICDGPCLGFFDLSHTDIGKNL